MDRPAKYITQLTDRLTAQAIDLKVAQGRVAQLESNLKDASAREADERRLRLLQLHERNEVAAKLHDAQVSMAQRSTQDALFYTATIGVLGHAGAEAMRADPIAHLAGMVCEHAAEVACLHRDQRKTVNELNARIIELEQRDAILDEKERDIRELVAKIEDRMRRGEREEASAILNRRALATAVPGKLRR